MSEKPDYTLEATYRNPAPLRGLCRMNEVVRFFIDASGQFYWIEKFSIQDSEHQIHVWCDKLENDLKQSEAKRAAFDAMWKAREEAWAANPDTAKQLEEEFNTKKLPVECLVNSPIFCRVKVRAGAQTPLTPADLDWSGVGLENGWIERDIVWTKLSTGETMTCRQPLKKRTKIYTNSTIESLRKHPHILLSCHSIVLDDEVWVADI